MNILIAYDYFPSGFLEGIKEKRQAHHIKERQKKARAIERMKDIKEVERDLALINGMNSFFFIIKSFKTTCSYDIDFDLIFCFIIFI